MNVVDIRTVNGCFSEAEIEANFGVPSTKIQEYRINGFLNAGVIYLPMVDMDNDSIEMSEVFVYTDIEVMVTKVLMGHDTIGEVGRKLARVAASGVRQWDYRTRFLLVTPHGFAYYEDHTVAREDADRLASRYWLVDMARV